MQLNEFVKWLNPKGYRDLNLIKSLKTWLPEIEAGITRRRILAGLEDVPEGEEPLKKARPVRKVVAAGGGDRGGHDDATGFLAWKVSPSARDCRIRADGRTDGQGTSSRA